MRYQELRRGDLNRLIGFTHLLYECDTVFEIEKLYHASFRELLDGDVTVWNEVLPSGEIAGASTYPEFDESFWMRLAPQIGANIYQHPFFEECVRPRRSCHAFCLEDFPAHGRFLKSDLYNGPYREWACRDFCVSSSAIEEGKYLALQLNRSSVGFSKREREIVQAVTPHIHNAQSRLRLLDKLRAKVTELECGDGSVEAWFRLGSRLQIVESSTYAELSLARRFQDWKPSFFLPDDLHRSVASTLKTLIISRESSVAFEQKRGKTILSFRLHQVEDAGYRLDLIANGRPRILNVPELTPVELEVVRWACEGKMNAEIAIICSVSRKTIEKRLTRIYKKLGVQNRRDLMVTLARRRCI